MQSTTVISITKEESKLTLVFIRLMKGKQNWTEKAAGMETQSSYHYMQWKTLNPILLILQDFTDRVDIGLRFSVL
jgi:hypothetical protein